MCKNLPETPKQNKKTHVGPLNCKFCSYITNAKFNMERHMTRKHKDGATNLPPDNLAAPKSISLESLLGDVGLNCLEDKFKKEGIDLKLLLELEKEDMRG